MKKQKEKIAIVFIAMLPSPELTWTAQLAQYHSDFWYLVYLQKQKLLKVGSH